MSRRREYRSPSRRRHRRDSFSPQDRRRDDHGRSSTRRRARSLSYSRGYESITEKYRSRRRPRRRGYGSESDGIHSDNAEVGSDRGRERDLESDRSGSRRGRYRGRRRGRRVETREEKMKKLILDFFEDYRYVCKMVTDETELIRKMPCMERHDKHYKKSHKLVPLDGHVKPQRMLKDLLHEVKSMGDKLNSRYRSKFLDENENYSGDDLQISHRSRRTRSSRRSPDRSRRRRDSGRRDSYDRRRSSRRSRY